MNDIDASIRNLRELVAQHSLIGQEILNAAEGALYPIDLLAITALNRSVALLVGFCDLLDKRNFVAGAPLLRLQLDNLLRFHAAWLVDKPHEFATEMLAGKRASDMKDRAGKKMTDSYLVDRIAIEYPPLKGLYKHTSGYIHLSEKHFFNALTIGDKGWQFNAKLSPEDSYVSEEIYLEAVRAFLDVTGLLFRYMKGWATTKGGLNKAAIEE